MIALDTNLLVRLLTNDVPREAAKVEAWLQQHTSARSPAYVDHIVVCELVWVLERSYGYARAQIGQALDALLGHDHLRMESPNLLRQALALYSKGPADFSDYLLAVRAQAAGFAPVLTLDKKAAKTATHQLLR
ncbi:PIN domain-containing protein [Rhodoferax sp.]|uniref:PIN domain-containing protein n=1 Tax=Rhodoferax sp. TaxID=50421 RepID=UPI0027722D11|nr:type II toxin-antitoxin system VapC family toxin [Rhodoferax sp.]